MYPKRTKKESLKRCQKLWETIVTLQQGNPRLVEKNEAYKKLGWAYRLISGVESSDDSGCPACTYNRTHPSKDFCGPNCIIKWPSSGCMADDSPYYKWEIAYTPKAKLHWATKVLALIN